MGACAQVKVMVLVEVGLYWGPYEEGEVVEKVVEFWEEIELEFCWVMGTVEVDLYRNLDGSLDGLGTLLAPAVEDMMGVAP